MNALTWATVPSGSRQAGSRMTYDLLCIWKGFIVLPCIGPMLSGPAGIATVSQPQKLCCRGTRRFTGCWRGTNNDAPPLSSSSEPPVKLKHVGYQTCRRRFIVGIVGPLTSRSSTESNGKHCWRVDHRRSGGLSQSWRCFQ